MSLFRRPQTSRAYPAAGTQITGPAGRFRQSKTSGAREADRAARTWEDADRAREARGGTRLTRWTR